MIGLVGAMEDEIQLLRLRLENVKVEKNGGFEYLSGELEGKSVVVLRCGIGKVSSAVGCAVLIDRYKPSLVINTGSAGGMGEKQSIGDVVIASALAYHDVDLTAFGYAPGQLPGQSQTFPVRERYMAAAEQAIDELKAEKILPASMNYRRGLIGSSDTFMHDAQMIEQVKAVFAGIAAVDMEAASIAHTCTLFGVDVMVIRALSDIAGADSAMKFDEFLAVASTHSAEIVRRIVRIIG
ncbi:MAG: 5'-methylthioadenosine/S-adenosylhomocysteine nucleosidase [Spirochaetaceae bacterium]|jgi:adenosylhomocysteine nucleosidase|nr:5'-methylthioadenosine/S-adenosylhomocysteine nucleosidase [Spirochaetaceae bacterium]